MKLGVSVTGEGKPLVLVHGWGMNAGVWNPVLPLLEREWQVTAIELPGHGESEAPQGEADITAWAAAALDAAPDEAVWVGWSLGAQLVIEASLMKPDRVKGIVAVSGTPSFLRRDNWPAGMQPELLAQFADNLFTDPQKTILRFLGLQVRGAENEREILRLLKSGLASRPVAGIEGLRQGLKLLETIDQRQRIDQLAVPSAWIYGDRDTLVSAATAEEIGNLLPEASIQIIQGAGHAPFLSHPDALLESLREVAA